MTPRLLYFYKYVGYTPAAGNVPEQAYVWQLYNCVIMCYFWLQATRAKKGTLSNHTFFSIHNMQQGHGHGHSVGTVTVRCEGYRQNSDCAMRRVQAGLQCASRWCLHLRPAGGEGFRRVCPHPGCTRGYSPPLKQGGLQDIHASAPWRRDVWPELFR